MCGEGQAETDEVEEGGNGMNDENGGQGVSSAGGETEAAIAAASVETICPRLEWVLAAFHLANTGCISKLNAGAN